MELWTASGLARGGALVAIVSLLTPWYVLEAHGLRGEGKSGAAALGAWSVVLVLLALVSASSLAAHIHRLLPPTAGVALALLVLASLISPPSAALPLGATGGTPLQQQLQDAFVSGIRDATGLYYAPAWGIWLAALGAAAALLGATVDVRGSPRRA